ncbi:AHA1 [Mactra antiquata]
MAKWGEGDPRWIVEERPDAKNVNNWHWTEKNATNWSKDKIKELLSGLLVESNDGTCEITSITSMDGEATANNRKAKLIFFYEFVIKGEWSGRTKDGHKKYKGKFEIPNLSEENEAVEVDVNITVDKENDEGIKLKEIMRKVGKPLMQQQFAKYIKMLKEEYSHNVILPTKDQKKPTMKSEEIVNTKQMSKMAIDIDTKPSTETTKPVGVKIATKTLKLKEKFICRPSDLYRVFTEKELVQAFTGASAIYEVEKGGRISLMNGFVTGGFLELVPDKKIVKRWRLKTWPDAHFSEVTLEFEDEEGNTVLKLTQSGIPSQEFEKTVEGWRVNYWERIKQIFGYGSRIF